ncbi:MAG: glyoxalase [Azospira oryzae]|jgi:hypothetical protein|nr:MAG: glyoxalase [Azospira oryzae]
MDAQWINTFQDSHVAAWNERDRATRDQLLKTIYATHIKMYDPAFVFPNLTEVSDFIGKLHSDNPEFYFSAAKPMEATQNGVRFYGHIGTRENPNIMNSMDFFIIENGKATHLYVFMEKGE